MTITIQPLRNTRVLLRVRHGGRVTSRTFPSEAAARTALREAHEVIEMFTVDGEPVLGLLEAALPRWAYPLIPGWSAA